MTANASQHDENHDAHTHDAPHHMRDIAGMMTAAEIRDKSQLHGAYTCTNKTFMVLHLKDDQIPSTLEEYEKWLVDTQQKLGKALKNYRLTIDDALPGDGSKASYERWAQQARQLASDATEEERRKLNQEARFEELRANKTLLVSMLTPERIESKNRINDFSPPEEHYRHEEVVKDMIPVANSRLTSFIDDLIQLQVSGSKPHALRGPQMIAQAAKEQRLRAHLKESLYHFDDVSILDASGSNLAPINGAVTLEMTLSKAYWKILLDRAGVEASQKAGSALGWLETKAPHTMKHLLGKDLGHYGLAPVTGRFNPATRIFTFTVTDKENYKTLQSDNALDYSKALGKEQPSEQTLQGVKRYLDDFACAKKLGLEKAQGRQL